LLFKTSHIPFKRKNGNRNRYIILVAHIPGFNYIAEIDEPVPFEFSLSYSIENE